MHGSACIEKHLVNLKRMTTTKTTFTIVGQTPNNSKESIYVLKENTLHIYWLTFYAICSYKIDWSDRVLSHMILCVDYFKTFISRKAPYENYF